MPVFYQSPGVYVEEVPSAVRPIAGVGTSTAAFVGVFEADSVVPYQCLVVNEVVGVGTGSKASFELRNSPVRTDTDTFTVKVNGSVVNSVTLTNEANRTSKVNFTSSAPPSGQTVLVSYQVMAVSIVNEAVGTGTGQLTSFDLAAYPALTDRPFVVKVNGTVTSTAWLTNDETNKKAKVNFLTSPGTAPVTVEYLTTDSQFLDETVTGPNFTLAHYPVRTETGTFTVKVNGNPSANATLQNDDTAKTAKVVFSPAPTGSPTIKVDYQTRAASFTETAASPDFNIRYPAVTGTKPYTVRVEGVQDAGAVIVNDETNKKAKVVFSAAPPKDKVISADYSSSAAPVAKPRTVVACASFGDFKRAFGDFSTDPDQRKLAHAVYGFFNNGGTRCYVVRAKNETDLESVLDKLDAIDDVALVAAPGITAARNSLVTHCRVRTGDRFALLESDQDATGSGLSNLKVPFFSD